MNPIERNAGDGEPNASQTPASSVPLDIESAMLTVTEVAAILHIGVRSVWRKSQDGRLPPPIKMTGSTRWAKSTLHEWMTKQTTAAEKQSPPRRHSKL